MTLLVLALLFQIGSPQYPGQYPPGQYPGGGGQGPGIPMPRRSKKATAPDKGELLQQMVGFVRVISAKSLDVAISDSRTIEFRLTEKTEKPEGLKPGDYVVIDAGQNDDGLYTAAKVVKKDPPKGVKPPPNLVEQARETPESTQPDNKKKDGSTKDAGKEEPKEVAVVEPPTTIEKAPVKYDSGDEPPKLKRGVPTRRPAAPGRDEVIVAQSTARNSDRTVEERPVEVRTIEASGEVKVDNGKPADPNMELLERARKESDQFLAGLPNYFCQQFTTRYVGEGRPMNWQAQDVVSAELVYEDGKEEYRKVQINGKAVKGKIEETGSWSTGEFGTVLRDIFHPATAAVFRYAGYESISKKAAGRFPFTVEREGSHWKIGVPGQYINPAYKGNIWVEKETNRVLRIEMQAVKIPKEFPQDTTEMAIDYDWVTLGGTQKFLLPIRSEVLSCTRGSSQCTKNTIEFRNYKKFGAKSDIEYK